MPIVSTFNYGITRRLDSSLTDLSAAQQLINSDPDKGILCSAKNFTKTTRTIFPYFYNYKGGWVSNYNPTDYVEWQDVLYWTEDKRPARKYNDGSSKLLGIKKPEVAPTFVIETEIGTLPVATRQYCITYYNADDDTESAPSAYTDDIVTTAINNITITTVASTDPQVTHTRIYRIGNNLTEMGLVTELASGTLSFTDGLLDPVVASNRVLTSFDHYPPEEEMHSLTESYGRFYGLYKNQLRFSEVNEPGTWPPEFAIELREEGTGILNDPRGLIVLTKSTTYLVSGTNPGNFARSEITNTQGCLTNKSCQLVKNSPLFISFDGICTIQSGYVDVVSRPYLDKITLDIKQTAVYDQQYFILKNDGTILVMDLRSGIRFYEMEYDEPIDGLHTHEGELYFACGGVLCTAFTGDDLTLKYTSPVFIEKNHADEKLYNHVYIRHDGVFNIKMFIDGKLVITDTLPTSDAPLSMVADLTFPATGQRGHNCHFEIDGKGKIYTIEAMAPIQERIREIKN